MLPATFTPKFLAQLELLRLRSRRAFLGTRQGGHVSPKRGHGIEFSDYRQYELGDNPRHIDWGVYARSDRLYVKRFQEEQDLSLLIFLDNSASMFNPTAEGSDNTKWQLACDLALAIAYVALIEQDTVVIALSDGKVTPHFSGARAIHQLAAFISTVKPHQFHESGKAMKRALSSVRFPGVAVLISDLLMEPIEIETMLRLLRAKNFDANVLQVLGTDDRTPLPNAEACIAIDSETGSEVEITMTEAARTQYEFLLQRHIEHIKALCSSNQMRYLRTEVGESLPHFVTKQLAGSGLLG